ncbi:unnamed protein product [Coccothraustes coccothraustes]
MLREPPRPGNGPFLEFCVRFRAQRRRNEELLERVQRRPQKITRGVSNALYNEIWLSENVEEFKDTFNIFLVGLEGSIKLSIMEISQPKRRKSPEEPQ